MLLLVVALPPCWAALSEKEEEAEGEVQGCKLVSQSTSRRKTARKAHAARQQALPDLPGGTTRAETRVIETRAMIAVAC